MRCWSRVLACVAIVGLAPGVRAQDTLHVLRHAPADTASPSSVVTITFDRPIAGALDDSANASRLVHIVPAVAALVQWRDPITIRVVPREPLKPGERYTISVERTVRGEDGSRLSAPYSFSFRVAGPKLLQQSYYRFSSRALDPQPRLRVLYTAPVDLERMSRAKLEITNCSPNRTIALVARQHPVGPNDPSGFQRANRYPRDTISDRFYSVVELEPADPVPLDCDAFVVLPTTSDDAKYGREEKFFVHTARTFRVRRLYCGDEQKICDPGSVTLDFASPVSREAVERLARLDGQPVVISSQAAFGEEWTLRADLHPRARYTVHVDSAIRDVYGRRLTGTLDANLETADYLPLVQHARGSIVVPSSGLRTFPVRSRNTQFVRLFAYRVADSLRFPMIAGGGSSLDWMSMLRGMTAETTIVELPDRLNADTVTEIPLPRMAFAPDHPLVAVRLELSRPLSEAIPLGTAQTSGRFTLHRAWPTTAPAYTEFATVQVTDLSLTARLVGATDGSAFVTSLSDGRPLTGVTVTQIDSTGRLIARGTTAENGVAPLLRIAPDSFGPRVTNVTVAPKFPRVRVLHASLGDDHVSVSLGGRAIGYSAESPLDPSRLGVQVDDKPLVNGAIFTDRDIFRPGETVHVKAVRRDGLLGDLRLPSMNDSARIRVSRVADAWREDGVAVIRDTVFRLSEFGTIVDSLRLSAKSKLSYYVAQLQIRVQPEWRTIASVRFRVAEYRAPTFSVDLATDTLTKFSGEYANATVRANYLFGAPAAGTTVNWAASALQFSVHPRPEPAQYRNWIIGDAVTRGTPRRVTGTAKLDSRGEAIVRIPAAELAGLGPSFVRVSTAVTDVDRQAVTKEASITVAGARMYLYARATTDPAVKQPENVELRLVDPTGAPLSDASIHALVVREHQHFSPDGPRTGIDTIRNADLDYRGGAASLTFVPDTAATYSLTFTATDRRGNRTRTSFYAFVRAPAPAVVVAPPALRPGLRFDVKADSNVLTVGSVAHVRFTSPFDDAEAWIKIEREGIFEERRLRVARGVNTIEVPILAQYAPSVYASVVLMPRENSFIRQANAMDRLLIGYAQLRVTTEHKLLSVALRPDRGSYAPRDTAAITIAVRDAQGRGRRSEVALWAIDEGVLALTGFRTPDIGPLIYANRGIGGQLWSTVPMLLTTDPGLVSLFMRPSSLMLMSLATTGVAQANFTSSVSRSPADTTPRADFSSSAFYLGAVRTDEQGNAVARARVPDNLTTFRVMAVAVSADDRYGKGDTTMLVTRPLVARAELPRFVRATDSLVAGIAVTARDGRARGATTNAEGTGLLLKTSARVSIALTPTSAAEARFVFTAPTRDVIGDSVGVLLGASDGTTGDATRTWLPVRPDYHPRTHAVLGATRDSQDLVIELPKDIDPHHSRMRLRIGTSHLSAMLVGVKWLIAYRFDCSEQIASMGRSMIAVWYATRRERSDALGGDPKPKLQELADELSRRQLPGGSIALWPAIRWSSPWLSAYAGLFLLEARDLGVRVDSGVVSGISAFLRRYADTRVDTGGMNRYEQRINRMALGSRVAAVEFLRRAGQPDTTAERALLRVVAAMTWEDRLHLAEVVAPRADMRVAATALVDAAWRTVTPAGHRVDLPDSSHGDREFPSRIAPAARLLSASLALHPDHPLLGALMETVLQQGKAETVYAWNTQDYASVVMALGRLGEVQAGNRVVNARAADRRFVARPSATDLDTTIAAPLDGMLERGANGKQVLRLHVDAGAGDRPVYFALEVEEVPLVAPTTPDIKGIVVERWYERFEDGKPVKEVKEGDIVRVRLRVTVPADRQFVVLEDPLPAGLEPIDNSLRTSATLDPFATPESGRAAPGDEQLADNPFGQSFLYGNWIDGHWSPWEYREFHDDRVTYFARAMWTGAYTATYIARATVAGSFVAPPAYSEEMYNPALQGRTAGSRFLISRR